MVLGVPDVFDSLQRSLAIATFGSLGGLVHSLHLQLATGSSDRTSLVLSSVVGVASHSGPTGVRHIDNLLIGLLKKEKGRDCNNEGKGKREERIGVRGADKGHRW